MTVRRGLHPCNSSHNQRCARVTAERATEFFVGMEGAQPVVVSPSRERRLLLLV